MIPKIVTAGVLVALMVEKLFYDLFCGVGMPHSQRIRLHRLKPSRIAQQSIDFVSQSGQIVAADCNATFEQVIRIPFFLSGNRVDDDENQTFRQRLARRQAAGFADDQIGSRHIFVHLGRESDGNDTAVIVFIFVSRQLVFQFLVAPAHRQNLDGLANRLQRS